MEMSKEKRAETETKVNRSARPAPAAAPKTTQKDQHKKAEKKQKLLQQQAGVDPELAYLDEEMQIVRLAKEANAAQAPPLPVYA